MADTTLLISGVGGFLGSHLAERALREGHRVLGLDNFCTGQKKNVEILKKLGQDRFVAVEGDACSDWSQLFKNQVGGLGRIETVFHFASPASPPHYQRLGLETMWVNSLGLNRALEFADAHKSRVIFSSTSEIYGDPQVEVQSESYRGWVNTVGPRSCYDEAKRFGESLIFTHNLKHKTQHGIVRIFNTYGPRMNPADGRVIINFLVQGLKGQDLTVYGDGHQTRSFCFVDDLIEGIWRFSRQTQHLGPMNIGNPDQFSVLEVAQQVRALCGSKSSIVHQNALPDDPQKRRPDLTLATAVLGWKPLIPLKDGLARMRDWLSSENLA